MDYADIEDKVQAKIIEGEKVCNVAIFAELRKPLLQKRPILYIRRMSGFIYLFLFLSNFFFATPGPTFAAFEVGYIRHIL